MREIIERIKATLRRLHPAKLVVLGYILYILLGWLLLSLPFAQAGPTIKAIDNLFTATSAVSTTGLTTVSTSDQYNFFGQVVILVLIQLGGIGYMTFGSFVILSGKTTFSKTREDIGKTVFSLPASFKIDKFIRSVIFFTLVIESIGAIALFFIFANAGDPNAVWSSIFHSVSAFCTAGFSLYNNSFEGFVGDFWLTAVIAALSYLGAIGFIVCVDLWRLFQGKIKKITLTSKIILWATFWLSIAGTILIFLSEPSVQDKHVEVKLMASFFQAMTALTTVGFNTIGIAQISKASLLLIIILMVIGASPSGTGGGLKSTTFSALLGVMRSAVRGEHEVRFWGRQVPMERVWTAIASLGFYLLALLVGTYLLEMTEGPSFDKNFFEAASALGTVGLSTGITASLTTIGKFIITMLMFFGRIGPLTFGIALFCMPATNEEQRDSDLAV